MLNRHGRLTHSISEGGRDVPEQADREREQHRGLRGSAMKSWGATRNSCIFAVARVVERMLMALASGLIGCSLVERVDQRHEGWPSYDDES